MAFPAPDYAAGSQTTDPDKGAQELYRIAGWIRRRCNEYAADSVANVFVVYDIAGLCQRFRTEADKWIKNGSVTAVLDALVRIVQEGSPNNPKLTAEQINTEATAVYQACGTFLTFATANLPAQGATVPNATVTVNRSFPNTDLVATVPKTAGLTNAIAALRAAFD